MINVHFWAPLNNARSLGVSPTSMIFAPASNCMMSPDVTIGEIPNSIKVPKTRKQCALVELDQVTQLFRALRSTCLCTFRTVKLVCWLQRELSFSCNITTVSTHNHTLMKFRKHSQFDKITGFRTDVIQIYLLRNTLQTANKIYEIVANDTAHMILFCKSIEISFTGVSL